MHAFGSRLSGRRIVATLAATALPLVAVVGAVSPAHGQTEVGGNPTCSQLAPGTTELKIDPVPQGTTTQSDGTLTVTIVVNGAVFDWSSNIGVNAVFVKAGNSGLLYVYDPPATSDTGLHGPENKDISHILFCYGISPPPTTTTTTTTAAPPTEAVPAPAAAVSAAARFTG
jgi:hypothetical protein